MKRFWPWPRGGRVGDAGERPRRTLRPEFLPLEDRTTPVISSVTVVPDPKVILPADGRYVPVTVSGKITQTIVTDLPGHVTVTPPQSELDALNARNERVPPPGQVVVRVTDQYRRDEPRLMTTYGPSGTADRTFFQPATKFSPTAIAGLIRVYEYSFTINLQAKASNTQGGGRHYYINVFSSDKDGGNDATGAVFVPDKVVAAPRTRSG